MNTITSPSRLPGRRTLRTACAVFAAALATSVSAQIFSDDFEGEAIDPEVWGVGSTGSKGTQEINAGWAKFDSVVGDPNTRSGAVTHRHDFNPFAEPFQIVYSELFVLEDTVAISGASSFYGSVGRYVGDEGGESTGALASSFGVGAYPGALGFQILKYDNGTWRLQILDMGDATDDSTDNRLLSQMQVQLDKAPTDLTLGIDGANATFYIEIVGAVFGDTLVNQLNGTVHSETLVSGQLTNFTEFGIKVSDTTISRLAIGIFSGTNGSNGPTIGEIGAITVEAYDPPEIPATSIFAEYEDVDGWKNTSFVEGAGIGWIHDGAYPFIWSHDAEAWLYVHEAGASASSFFAWHYGSSNWIWTSIDWDGFYWDYAASSVLSFASEEAE